MLESIKDDGTGGDSEKNNREYSGSFTRDGNGVNAVFPIIFQSNFYTMKVRIFYK